MLEAARSLLAAGENVALLSLLDSYPAMRHLKLGSRVRLAMQLARRRASTIRHGSIRPNSEKQLAPTMQRVLDAAFLALQEYRPRFYDGEIKFVRAVIPTVFPEDATAVWSKLASKIEVETVPGDHHGMLVTHFESLATVVSRYLSEASGS
jgi:thioesterase domain-containing protein